MPIIVENKFVVTWRMEDDIAPSNKNSLNGFYKKDYNYGMELDTTIILVSYLFCSELQFSIQPHYGNLT